MGRTAPNGAFQKGPLGYLPGADVGVLGGHVAVGGPEAALPLGGGEDLEDLCGVRADVDGEGDGSVHDDLRGLAGYLRYG